MKRFTLLLCSMLLGIMGAWADTYTITFDHRTGTFYKSNVVSTGWVNKWVSNESGKPAVTITASANNINTDNGRFAPGSSTYSTYSISVEDGYIITGFSLNCPTFGAEVTVTPTGESATTVATGETIVVNSSATSFVYSGSNSGRIQASAGDGGSFTITVEDDPDYVDWTPSISSEAFVTVGDKVESISPVTEASDNSKWYIITQVRGGESPMYNVSTGSTLYRAAANITPATINGTLASSSLQYLVRFIEVGTGLYNMQFANGDFITSSLTTSASKNDAGTYAFYNSNGGSGSYFGWNKNSNTGDRVDNNAAGNTVAFWSSGIVSGTSGNNIWYVYATEVEIPSTTYVYQISDDSGVVFTSDAYSATAGDVISTIPSNIQLPYCTYDVTPKTIENGENIVSVTVSYNLPFTASTDFENATWYYATLRGKYLRADDSAKDDSGRYATNSTNEKTDAYKWAFFGNPYTGIYVMNKNQGDGKYLYKETQLVFKSGITPTADNNALFAVTPNSNGGFSLRNIAGGATWYINDAGGNGNLGFWNSSAGANDGGSNWAITEVPANTIDVTYALYVGGEYVTSVVDEQVAQNSDVAVPASLISAYSTLAYDIATQGTISTENCTINVMATMKTGVITALNQLSNLKSYTLITARGALGTNGTQMVSSNGTAYSASNFAIISYEDNYYLYSVADSKWVGNPTTINSIANQPALTEDLNSVTAINFDATYATTASPLFFMGMGSNGVNVSNYTTGIVVNSWTTLDAGNQYCIIESVDFDPTEAIAALDEFFHPAAETLFNEALDEIEAINWGTGLGQYCLTGEYAGYTSQLATIIAGFKAQGYTDDNLAILQALLANYALNMPAANKFYRITSTHGTYLSGNASTAQAGRLSFITNADASTIFYFDGEKLYDLANGRAAAGRAVGTAGGAGITYWFEESTITAGKYAIRFNPDGYTDRFLYAWDTSKNYADQNGADASNCVFTIEEITTLPVNISAAGYATLYSPVALTIPYGVQAYTGVVENTWLAMTEVSDVIPANTAVILEGNEGSYDFVITTADAFTGNNDLQGTVGGKVVEANSILTLQNIEDVPGLYSYTGTTLAGFKAYLDLSGSEVKSLTFRFDLATGINGVSAASNDNTIYNLAGQRVNAATKGIYIVNGKKVVIK